MKESMSNIDIRLILAEVRPIAEGAFVKNVYQYGRVFVLKLYQPGVGTSQLLIEPGCRIHLTEFRRAAPRMPPKFCGVLRKYLRDKRVTRVVQHDLDRIVVIEIGENDERYKLVAELFGNGNLLLLDPDDTIFVALHYRRMRDRDVIPKAKYEFPPPRGVDIFTMEGRPLDSIIIDSKANVVRTLASRLNLDSLSCEEICVRAGVAPTSKVTDLDEGLMRRLSDGVREFRDSVNQGVNGPRIILSNEGETAAFIPFEYEVFRGLRLSSCPTCKQFLICYAKGLYIEDNWEWNVK